MKQAGIRLHTGIREWKHLFSWKLIAAFLAIGVTLAGCATRPVAPAPPRNAVITEVNLITMPVALNLNATPGADGVQLRVFLVAQGHSETVPIPAGRLEIVAYDGSLNPTSATTPFRVWRFNPDDLAPDAFTSAVGAGYNLILSWAPEILTHKRVTVVARYYPPKGPVVVSAPSSIAATSS